MSVRERDYQARSGKCKGLISGFLQPDREHNWHDLRLFQGNIIWSQIYFSNMFNLCWSSNHFFIQFLNLLWKHSLFVSWWMQTSWDLSLMSEFVSTLRLYDFVDVDTSIIYIMHYKGWKKVPFQCTLLNDTWNYYFPEFAQMRTEVKYQLRFISTSLQREQRKKIIGEFQEFCPPFWDEASCFPPTLANSSAVIPCMSSYGSDRYNTSCKIQRLHCLQPSLDN